MRGAYYNEFDPNAAAWLRNLIAAERIAPGDVDERSITDVRVDDLRGYTQCHFFAGIGVWSHALRRAGWSDDRQVWTGSCPCQPFSAAGKRGGFNDERHLWPEFYRLIRQCRPARVFGEQVASKDGLAWLDTVYADLENAHYAVGAADLCAAGVGAPHIRQRLWFTARPVAYTAGDGHLTADGLRAAVEPPESPRADSQRELEGSGHAGGLAHPIDAGLQGGIGSWTAGAERSSSGHSAERGAVGGLADAAARGQSVLGSAMDARHVRHADGDHGKPDDPRPTNGHWRSADWLYCRDGKWRPVEPGTFPLAHGAAARVGRLRAYGNAIVAQVAEEFIRSSMECF